MRNSSPALLALLCLPALGVNAQEIEHTTFELPNGLRVILHEDHSLPLVAVNIWYYVGGKDEPEGRSGFAHLFEHLMFMGTKKFPYPTFDTKIEESGGSNNATTSSDRTNYFESGPRELLETFLELEADRMSTLDEDMNLEKLNTQREVVRNERRQRYENRPYGQVQLEIPKQIYPEDHPYNEPVIGSHEEIEAASVDDVIGFFRRFYFAGNASLCIAGDFDSKEATQLVKKHFGPLEKRPALERSTPKPPKIERTVRVTLEDKVQLPLLVMVWHSPAHYKDGDAEMDVLASALSEGKASRLYRSLVYEQKIAQSINVFQFSKLLGSEFWVYAMARPGIELDALEAAIDAEIEKLKKDGPTDREVERARNKIAMSFWQEIEGISNRADLLNRYQFSLGSPDGLKRDLARYDKVTRGSAREWADKILRPDQRLILRVVPKANSAPPSGGGNN